MKKLFILTLTMVMAALIMPNEINAQKWLNKKKTGDTEKTSDTEKSSIGISKEMVEKDKPDELFTKIEDQRKLISTHQKSLKENYGETYTGWQSAEEEMNQLEFELGKKSTAYKTAEAKQESLEESNDEFKKETKVYKDELKELDGLTNKLVKTVMADFKEDYAEKYEKYADKRPEPEEINLNPSFWGLVFQDPAKLNTLQNLVSLNSLLYGLSVVYTDLYFKNDKESAFMDRMQADWQGEFTELKKKNASIPEVDLAYSSFANNAKATEEYKVISQEKEKTRQEIKQQFKETSFSALSLALNQMLGGDQLSSVEQPDTMSMKSWAIMVKNEGKKAKTVIDMLLKTSKGTSLVSRQAVKSCVVKLKTNSAEKDSEAFIIANENIEILVEESGKQQRFKVVDRKTTDSEESVGLNLSESDESMDMAYSKYEDIEYGINSEEISANMTPIADDSEVTENN